MIMRLDYQFNYDGQTYNGLGIDIGETTDIENERKDVEGLKVSAICNAFNLTVDDSEVTDILKNSTFDYCELGE